MRVDLAVAVEAQPDDLNPMTDLYIGLMSGTSLDGVDGVLAHITADHFSVLAHAQAAFPDSLRREFLTLNTPGDNEIHRAALAANALARIYAHVVAQLLQGSGTPAADVAAIGAHGQTVRHQPQAFDVPALGQTAGSGARSGAGGVHDAGGGGYTVQLNNPALLAELCGIDVVADLRSRDVAAGGQGAPLVPAFHQAVFGRAEEAVAVLNVGGISNITLVPAQSGPQALEVIGFDCGPGNALIDYWCQKHTGHAFDDAGHWADSGHVHHELLHELLRDPFFGQPAPKSTGRDLFNPDWLAAKLAKHAGLTPADVQASLTELTAHVCVDALLRYQKQSAELLVCGGGALNTSLMRRMQERLALLSSQVCVTESGSCGLPPLQVEAGAFAWLARKAMQRETGNLPKATGAQGARILGAVYAA